jgi:hypothetical protein
VEVTFSEAVQAQSAEAAFRIDPGVDGAFSWSGTTLTFTPAERLPLETQFSVLVVAGVRDEAGNATDQDSAPLNFTTVGHPLIVASQPEPGTDEVALDAPIVLEFSTLMDTASVEAALRLSPRASYVASWSEDELTLSFRQPLAEGRQYTLQIGTDALDAEGIPLGEPYELQFTTVRTSLEPAILFPADETVGVSPHSPIAVVFDRELASADAPDDAFRIEPAVAGTVAVRELPGAAGLATPGLTALVFQPSGPLQSNTTYTVTLDAEMVAADDSRLSSPVSWRFTTGAPPAALSNQVVFLSDRAGIANLWTMNPDGTGQRQLSAELSPVTAYAVAPSGRFLVIGDGARLVQLRPDGSDRRVLTPDDVLEFDPAYAPNGSALAFGRADAETGEGLGLWLRSPDGGDPTRLSLPDEQGADPTPSPTDGAAPGPVLRAPRFSPDGEALAFVNVTDGRLGVLELSGDSLSTAEWGATSPPAWLADSTGVLVGGLAEPPTRPPSAGPLPALDPAALDLSAIQLAAQQVGRLDRGARGVVTLDHDPGASRPATGSLGRYMFVVVRPGTPGEAGELWYAARPGATLRRLLGDGGSPVTSAAFGLEPDSVLAVRSGEDGSGAQDGSGIWLVDAASGRGTQLSEDGWLPRWLP